MLESINMNVLILSRFKKEMQADITAVTKKAIFWIKLKKIPVMPPNDKTHILTNPIHHSFPQSGHIIHRYVDKLKIAVLRIETVTFYSMTISILILQNEIVNHLKMKTLLVPCLFIYTNFCWIKLIRYSINKQIISKLTHIHSL